MHHFILDFSCCAEVWTYLAQARVRRKVFPVWVLCRALGAPHCLWPGDTSQLLCPREWMEQSKVQFGSFPREETEMCGWQCSGVTAVPQLPRLSPQQPQHKSHFKELHIHFSELKTCFYFHVTPLFLWQSEGSIDGNSS